MKLVVFDLDGTLIDCEAIDELAKLVGKEKEVKEITEKAMRGEIDFKTALIERVKHLAGLEFEKALEVAKNLPLMKGAKEAIMELKSRNIATAIITGSFDFIAERIKNELGIDYVIANKLVVKEGKLTGEVEGEVVENCSKGKALEKLSKELGISLDQCVAIGDGANDACMLEKAGLAIAFNSKEVLNDVADVIVVEKDLTKILPYILGDLNEEEKKKEKKELELKIKELKREINRGRARLRELRSERKNILDSIRELKAKAKEFKEKRDRLNRKVKRLKIERERNEIILKDYLKEYEKRKENAPKGNFRRIQRMINQLEWKLQTTVLDIKKEDEIVERIEKLKKQLEDYEDLIEIQKKIDRQRRIIRSLEDRIEKISRQADEAHNSMIEAVNRIKELKNRLDEIKEERKEIENRLDSMRAELKELLAKRKAVQKDIEFMEMKKSERLQRKRERELRKKAMELYEKFKRGEKLDLEGLYLLQRFNLI